MSNMIRKKEDLCFLGNGNKILGIFPDMKDSVIDFQGKDNILFCEDNVKFNNVMLSFRGDRGLIFIRKNDVFGCNNLSILIYSDCVCAIGCHVVSSFEGGHVRLFVSEHKHLFIGDGCFLSWNVVIRNSNAHPIFDSVTKERISRSASVFVGDHVWLGQSVSLLKGTQIDSGSILGLGTIVSGRKIPCNSCWAGNPAKMIRKDVFWNPSCLHDWTEEIDDRIKSYSDLLGSEYDDQHIVWPKDKTTAQEDEFIYEYDPAESISFDEIDHILSSLKSPQEKCNYLYTVYSNPAKNRFVHLT